MRAMLLPILPVLFLTSATYSARADDPMAFIRADQWGEAAAQVAGDPDPVAQKLVTYYRLLAPNAARASEIAAFIASSPDWPQQPTLAKRRDEALAAETDDAAVLPLCGDSTELATALTRCAEAHANLGRTAEAALFARRAWVVLPPDAAQEAKFLPHWQNAIGRSGQWLRFDRLAWSDTSAAARQAPRLDAGDRAEAEVRLALRRDDPNALTPLAALPADARADPALALEQARYLRRANQDAEAVKLWAVRGAAAERAVPAEHLTAFWDERNILARRRLRDGDPAGAYAVAAGHAQQGSEQIADAAFLAGFIALRKLNDPAAAAEHFRTLAVASKATITQGRAHYWLARAAASPAAARAEYALAAAYPSTFYGQLAALALAEGSAGMAARITSAQDPQWNSAQALDFAGRELARAAAYLAGWGEPRRAQSFLLRLADIVPDPVDRAMDARLASGFGLEETAITLSRRAGRDGVILLQAGWPEAVQVPPNSPAEPALALGIMRQESSFDTTTVSPVGARGLMQLMPGTAAQVAKQIGLHGPVPNLTADPEANMRLGTVYLHGLLDQFDGCVPLAVAAYNAGPSRVSEWLSTYGDPRTGAVDMLDWIEQIPFSETRNYVQRVIENTVIYRAKRHEAKAHPLEQWLK